MRLTVFCSKSFFGGAYIPTLSLRSEEITRLMKHIWSIRSSSMNLQSIACHPTYQAVVQSGIVSADNVWLLQSGIQQMHEAARVYKPGLYQHTVVNGEILYKIEGRDEYSKWSYSYTTNAEYLAEFERGTISEQQLDAGLALFVRCGLGVTGTLHDDKLPPQMKSVLKYEVGVREYTVRFRGIETE